MGPIHQFFKNTLNTPEIFPLVVILGGAFTGAGLMTYHQLHSPDVVWNHKTNENPWQQVRDGDQIKLAAFNQQYERRYKRKEW